MFILCYDQSQPRLGHEHLPQNDKVINVPPCGLVSHARLVICEHLIWCSRFSRFDCKSYARQGASSVNFSAQLFLPAIDSHFPTHLFEA